MRNWEEAPWSFRERLAKPMRPRLPQGGNSPPDAVKVEGGWRIVVDARGAAQQLHTAPSLAPLATAVSELQRFFGEAGINLTSGSPQENPETPSQPSIVLRIVSSLESGGPDSGGGSPVASGPVSNDSVSGDPSPSGASASASTDESYRIVTAPGLIEVEASSPRGVLHGVYALEDAMVEAGGPWISPGEVHRQPFLTTRILRSFWSPYYEDELTTNEDYYPDGYLETLSRMGINGVWIHGYLRRLVSTSLFPDAADGARRRLEKLNDLIARAGRFGIDVYLYFCEPKAIAADSPFWDEHPDVRGTRSRGNLMDESDDVISLCISSPKGRQYILEAYEALFKAAPGLGGVILITASENHSHCYSHGPNIDCPRCSQRRPEEVLSELLHLVEEGARRAKPDAKVIAWTWSWRMIAPDPQTDLIASLPDSVAVMPDFERGAQIVRDGKTFPLDEYSMCYIGPSPRFQRQAEAARASGRTLFAKMQLCTTHELATVPYYPVPQRWAAKWEGLRGEGVQGIMACWIFGNYPNFLLEIARELTWEPHPPVEELYARAARRLFGPGASEAVAAWRQFSGAFDAYPFSTPLIYYGPMNRAPSLPWSYPARGVKMPISCLVLPPGDTLDDWTQPFGPKLAQRCFEEVLSGWEQGLATLERAVAASQAQHGAGTEAASRAGQGAGSEVSGAAKQPTNEPTPAQRELIVAQAFAVHIRSTIHFLRFGQARDALQAMPADRSTSLGHIDAMLSAIRDEVANRQAYVPLVRADARLGYHSEAADYFFTAADVEKSCGELQALAEQLLTMRAQLGSANGAV